MKNKQIVFVGTTMNSISTVRTVRPRRDADSSRLHRKDADSSRLAGAHPCDRPGKEQTNA